VTAGLSRIGVFGGSFDPPHNAHVALVQAAVRQLQLDELRVFPTGHAWHKPRPLSAAAHRLAMARLAFADLPRVAVDERELQRAGPTYTIDTLRQLRAEQAGAQIFLILGEDQAAALPSWHQWPEILQIAIISIAGRAPSTGTHGLFDPSKLPQGQFEALQLPPMSVSATDIRALVAAGQGVAHLVPDGVARYIEQYHLYRTA